MTKAGTLIQAADFPPTVQGIGTTDYLNIASTSFADTDCNVTFTAPTSGKCMFYVGGVARNNSYNGTTNIDSPVLSLQVREDNASGTIHQDTLDQGWLTCRFVGKVTDACVNQRAGALTNLTPGQVYYAVVRYKSQYGSGSADIFDTSLVVRPLP